MGKFSPLSLSLCFRAFAIVESKYKITWDWTVCLAGDSVWPVGLWGNGCADAGTLFLIGLINSTKYKIP